MVYNIKYVLYSLVYIEYSLLQLLIFVGKCPVPLIYCQ